MDGGAIGMGLLGQYNLNPTANLMPKTSQLVLGVPWQQKTRKLGGLRSCPSYKPLCITTSLTMGNPLAFMLVQPCNFLGVHVVHNSRHDLFIYVFVFG